MYQWYSIIFLWIYVYPGVLSFSAQLHFEVFDGEMHLCSILNCLSLIRFVSFETERPWIVNVDHLFHQTTA